MHDAAAGKNKIVGARHARAACAAGQRSSCKLPVHTVVTTAVARLVHNDASHDGHRERRLTAAHSILAGAVAPHRDAQEAF